jgi:hypothetical protein
MIVKNIPRRLITRRKHPQPTRSINNPMIRPINNLATPLSQKLPIAIRKRAPDILRPPNPNTILIPAIRKHTIKITTLPMTKPSIVPAVPVTHPRPLLRLVLLLRDKRQLHRIRLPSILNRKQIIR